MGSSESRPSEIFRKNLFNLLLFQIMGSSESRPSRPSPPTNQIPNVEVGSTSVYITLPGSFPVNHTIKVKIRRTTDENDRQTCRISRNRPFQRLQTRPGVDYIYMYKTIDHETGLESKYEDDRFTCLKEETCLQSLKSDLPVSIKNLKTIKRNILIVGTVACGKSSLVNTLNRAFSEERGDLAKIFYSRSETVTKKPSIFQLKDSSIKIIDTAGLEKKDSEKLGMAKALIEGRLSLSGAESIDVIVYVHGFKDALASRKSFFDGSEEIFRAMKNSSVPCVGVLTCMDKLASDGEDAITIENYLDHPRVIGVCERFKQGSGIPYILPFINYTDFSAKNETRNQIALKILDYLLHC